MPGPFASEMWDNVLEGPVTPLSQRTAVPHVRYLTFSFSKITKHAITCAKACAWRGVLRRGVKRTAHSFRQQHPQSSACLLGYERL